MKGDNKTLITDYPGLYRKISPPGLSTGRASEVGAMTEVQCSC